MLRTFRNVAIVLSALTLTACPERPDTEKATQACENLLFIANQERAAAETEKFKAVSDEDQLKTALADFTKTLGEDKRAAGIAALKKTFKPISIEEQKKTAQANCETKHASVAVEADRETKLKECLAGFKPTSLEAQEKVEITKLEQAGTLPKAGDREAKIADFEKNFKATSPEDQAKAAEKAALDKLAKKLEEQKASDPKYKETLDTCVKGLQKLGTVKQADCMLAAKKKKEAEGCRNER